MQSKDWFGFTSKVTLLATSFLFVSAASAAILPGDSFGMKSDGVLAFHTGGTPGVNFIDFCPVDSSKAGDPNVGAGCGSNNTGMGTFLANPGSTPGSDWTTMIVPNSPGTILDIADQPGNPPYTYFPVGIPQTIDHFIVITAHPEWDFVATLLPLADCSGGGTCIGAFRLTQDNAGVVTSSVTLQILGQVRLNNISGALLSGFKTTITGQYNSDIATVLAQAASVNGAFSNTISASTLATAAPEPSTYAMMGLALILLASVRKRVRS